MIFGIWVLLWLSVAAALTELVLPAFAVLMRCSYVERRLPKLNMFVLAAWVCLAGFTALVPEQGLNGALLVFGRLFISGLLLIHLAMRLRVSRFKRVLGLRELWFFGSRAVVILSQRLSEIAYWIRVRVRTAEGKKIGTAVKYSFEGIVSFVLELLFLRRKLLSVVAARGEFPDNTEWLQADEVPNGWLVTAVGDILLLLTMLTPLVMGGEELIPQFIRQIKSFVQGADSD